MMKSFSLKEFFILFFLFFLLVYFLMNPYVFYDKISFLMEILVILLFFILFFCNKMVDVFYKNIYMVKQIFFLILIIMFFSFYYSSIFLFYIFFELSVIPIFIFIISWGTSGDKVLAGYYLFFFTFFSSLLFFLGLFLIYLNYGSFSYYLLAYVDFFFFDSFYFYLILFIFFVSMPIFIFHIWLPLAHVESPMIGSMLLAGLMLKLGVYGLMRVIMFFFFNFYGLKMYFFTWGIWGSIISSLICVYQIDMKKMVAYSSVSHMSMILMSLFSMNFFGIWGSVMMMLGHGLLSSVMFLMLGLLYYRVGSRNLFFLSSVGLIIPTYSMWWFSIVILNMGFPPFISFFSEFFLFLSMVYLKMEFILLGIFLMMITSIYSINMLLYAISGLKKSLNLIVEVNLLESLLLLMHFYYILVFIFCYWLI